jgi:hypothetical protein
MVECVRAGIAVLANGATVGALNGFAVQLRGGARLGLETAAGGRQNGRKFTRSA